MEMPTMRMVTVSLAAVYASGSCKSPNDPPPGRIVGGKFHGHAVADKDADMMDANLARHVGQYHAAAFRLDAKRCPRQRLNDGAGDQTFVRSVRPAHVAGRQKRKCC